jgi:hypothetical protein
VRRLLLAALVAAAGCHKATSPIESPPPPPQASCSADRRLVRAGEAAQVRCTATAGASGPTWSVEPRPGSVAPGPDGSATFVVRAADVGASFGDTTFTVGARYSNPGGSASGAVQVTVLGNTWVTRSDGPTAQAVASDGTPVGAPLSLPGLDGPPLAIASRADGVLLVAQRPGAGAPVLVYSRSGLWLGTFEAEDGQGTPLFSPDAPPRDLRQMRDGSVWVTGGKSPVVFDAAGRFRARAAAAPDQTIGLAQLPDGRVAVTCQWALGIGFYDEAGQTLGMRALLATPPAGESYGSLGALAVGPEQKLLVAASHLTPAGWTGTLLRLNPDLSLDAELPAPARVPRNVPYALALVGGELRSAPSPTAGDTQPACPERFEATLAGGLGCLVPGTDYRGVVHLTAPTASTGFEESAAARNNR